MPSLTPKSSKTARAIADLLFAAVIWGFGFTASIWALKSIDTISMSLIRFGLAFIIGLAIFKLVQMISKKTISYNHFAHFKYSLIPGFLLSMTLGFQTWGLEITTATNSGFITTLYVVLVPIFQKIFLGKKVFPIHALWVGLALLGTALMIQLQFNNLNKGDFLTLICAVFAALHIIWIGRVQNTIESAFLFNCYQCFWAALCTLLLIPLYDGELYIRTFDNQALFAMFSLTIGSTLLAFALQIRAQKVLSPSLASVLYLLESPFAAIFAFFLLSEVMSPMRLLGGALIFLSAIGATLTETNGIKFSRRAKC